MPSPLQSALLQLTALASDVAQDFLPSPELVAAEVAAEQELLVGADAVLVALADDATTPSGYRVRATFPTGSWKFGEPAEGRTAFSPKLRDRSIRLYAYETGDSVITAEILSTTSRFGFYNSYQTVSVEGSFRKLNAGEYIVFQIDDGPFESIDQSKREWQFIIVPTNEVEAITS